MQRVKITEHGQITLPADFREKLDIKEGDYLEAELDGKTIMLKPKLVMDRDDAVKALHQIMSDVQSRNKDIDPGTLEKEITEAIREVREQKLHEKSRT